MATDNIDIIIQAKVDQATKALARTRSQTNKLKKSNTNLSGSIGKIRSGYLLIAGVLTGVVATAIGKSIKGFQRFKQSSIAMEKQFGISSTKIIKKLREVSKGTISNADLVITANRAMALNVTKDVDKMAQLLEVARVRGQALGVDTSKAFEDIVTGIGRASPLILDNLGIITKGWDKEAKAAGRAFDSQFILNKILAEGAGIMERVGENAISGAEKIQRISATFENLSNVLGEELSVVLDDVAASLGEFDLSKIERGFRRSIRVVVAFLKSVVLTTRTIFNILQTPFQLLDRAIKTAVRTLGGFGTALKLLRDGEIKKFLKFLKDGALSSANSFSDVFKDNFNDIEGSAKDFAESIKLVFENLEKDISNIKLQPDVGGEAVDTKAIEKRKQQVKDFAVFSVQSAADTLEVVSSFINNQVEREENRKQTAIDGLNEQFAAGLISQEQFEQGKVSIEQRSQNKIRELKRKAFIANKAAAIIESIINTAVASTKALTAGPILGPIMARIIRGLGFFQTVAIASAPIPAFQTGGELITNGPQLIQVGDNPSGRERVSVEPLGGAVTNNTSTSNDNRNINITVQANDSIEFVNDLKRTYGLDVFS